MDGCKRNQGMAQATLWNRYCWVCCLVVLLLVGCRHVKDAKTLPLLRASNADNQLRAGDIFLLYEDSPRNAVQGVIRAGQELIKLTYSPFRPRLKNAKTGATHAAMYMGKGMLAEAEGTHPDNALVRMQTIDVHAGFRFLVFRSKDSKLAARAAAIARRWANGRMAYSVPGHALFLRPGAGTYAHRAALIFGRGAHRVGGPKEVKAMFCSQYVWAAYQAAVVAPQLAKNPKLTAKGIKLPAPLMLDANNISPMDITAQFANTQKHPQGFRQVYDFRVDMKALVKREGAGDWLKKKAGKALADTGKGIVKGSVYVGKKIGEGTKAAGKGIVKLFKGKKAPTSQRTAPDKHPLR